MCTLFRKMWSSQIEPVVFKERGLKKILADIYGSQYGSVKELGLADPATIKEFDSNLDSVKEQWEQLCPGFYKCFVAKRKTLFREKVIEEVRKESNVYGMYYNNNIKSMHFKEKTEQCHKLGSLLDETNTLKKIIETQQDDEVCTIYGSGLYRLSNEYTKFSIDNLKWHSMIFQERKKHVLAFRNYNPSLEYKFIKSAKSSRKPLHQTRKRKPKPDVLINRLENKQKWSAKKSTDRRSKCKKNYSVRIAFEIFGTSTGEKIPGRLQK